MFVGALSEPSLLARARTCTAPSGFTTRAATDWSVTSGVLTSVFGRYPAGIVAIWIPLHAGTDLLIAIDVVLQSTAREPNRETQTLSAAEMFCVAHSTVLRDTEYQTRKKAVVFGKP